DRFVLRLDARGNELHLDAAVIRATMYDVRRQIFRLTGFDLTRRLAGSLEGQGALDDIGDLVRIGVGVPGYALARGEGVELDTHFFGWIAGEVLHNQLLGFDLGRLPGIARQQQAGTAERGHSAQHKNRI